VLASGRQQQEIVATVALARYISLGSSASTCLAMLPCSCTPMLGAGGMSHTSSASLCGEFDFPSPRPVVFTSGRFRDTSHHCLRLQSVIDTIQWSRRRDMRSRVWGGAPGSASFVWGAPVRVRGCGRVNVCAWAREGARASVCSGVLFEGGADDVSVLRSLDSEASRSGRSAATGLSRKDS
jgi:hypothetical protein